MKHQYTCKCCGTHITLPGGSKFCPICGSSIESKVQILANEKTAELKELLPVLEEKYREFAAVYIKFKTIQETVRVYAARGIIDRNEVVNFKLESLTELFYASRKKKKSNDLTKRPEKTAGDE